MTNLILFGFQGVGKTTYGRRLAHTVGAPFYDTDELLLQNREDGLTCGEIVSEEGIDTFLSLEREVVASLTGVAVAVIALGGGTLEDADNRKVLQALGSLVYLEADEHYVKQKARILHAPFEAVYARRLVLFEALAERRISHDENTEENLEKLWLEIITEPSLRS